jgi:hypothetical protein
MSISLTNRENKHPVANSARTLGNQQLLTTPLYNKDRTKKKKKPLQTLYRSPKQTEPTGPAPSYKLNKSTFYCAVHNRKQKTKLPYTLKTQLTWCSDRTHWQSAILPATAT